MISKMYGSKEGIPEEKMRQVMSVMEITDVIKLGRLKRFCHVKRREKGNSVKRRMDMETEGRNPKVSPKLTWRQVPRQDLELFGMEKV